MRGHVRQRGSKWAFVMYLGIDELTGKRKYKWFSGFDTMGAAEKAMIEKAQEIYSGAYVEPTDDTLGAYMARWLEDKSTQIRPGTLRKYKWLINHHIIPGLGRVQLSKLKPQHLQSFYTKLLSAEKPLSNRSVLHTHIIIHEALNRAVTWGLVARNVSDAVDPPRPKKLQMKVWTKADVLQFLNAAEDFRYYIMFFLAITTGMRKSEIMGLRWSDIDLDRGRLSVQQVLEFVDKKPIFLEPKTDSGRRVVTIDPDTIESLRKHRHKQNQERLLMGSAYTDFGLVIAAIDGQPVSKSTIDTQWYAALKKSGVQRIRFHDLRHTHASLLLQQDVHPKIVQERLGHANIQITLDTYSHLLPGLQEQTAKDFGAALFGSKGKKNLLQDL